MYEALMIASTGVINQQKRIDVIADNVANVNTNGYKSSRMEFKDALYTAGFGPAATPAPAGNQQKGHGLMTASVSRSFTTGNAQTTGNMLDFMIEGEGFFEIEDAGGRTLYTRTGNMYLSKEADGQFSLVTAQGYYLHDADGRRVTVPDGTDKIEVSETGEMRIYNGDSYTTRDIPVYTFTNKTGLSGVGKSNYETTVASGTRSRVENPMIRQGQMEGSNVSLANEMTMLIRAQRAFSLASKALTTADDMEGIANNMKR